MRNLKVNKVIETIGWTSGLVTIAATGVGLVWFFFGLDNRLSTLENQMQAIYQSALSSPPQSVAQDQPKNSPNQPVEARATNNQLQKLVETCSELALRVATAYENTSPLTVAAPLEKMMDKLGCNKIVQ